MKRTKNQSKNLSFSFYDVERRTKKSIFYNQLNALINWEEVEANINKYYKKGDSAVGEKPYNGLLLFKMLLVGVWNNLSDVQLEEHLNDSLSAMKFCGMQLEDNVPDHSTISRFRQLLSKSNALDSLLSNLNEQLTRHQLILKTGVKVDASLTESPFRPKKKATYEIAIDRKEDEVSEEQKKLQTTTLKKIESNGVDKQARYLSKRGKAIFGYKKHHATDDNGIILAVHTTTANEHDSKGLKSLLKKVKRKYKKKGVFTDKGYKVPNNDSYLKQEKIKNRIQYKAYRNRPLTKWQLRFNKAIAETRWVVERTFGGLKRWFDSGTTRFKGKQQTHALHVLEAIAYNLKRSPNLVFLMNK